MAEEENADLPVARVINPSRVESRRNSIARASSEDIVVPHYRRASTGSCHDICKYGRRHVSEEKERLYMSNIVPRNPLCPCSEEDVGGTKNSMANRRASIDSKLPKKTSVIKLRESVHSEPQISSTSDNDVREMATAIGNSQKQEKNEVAVNRKKASVFKMRPLIHRRSHTFDFPKTRQGNSSVSAKEESSSKSNVEVMDTSSESAIGSVGISSKTTSKPVESSSELTAEPVGLPSKSIEEPVGTSTKLIGELVDTSSKSVVELVETVSKLTAEEVEASSKSIAKKVKASSKSTAEEVEASSKSSPEEVEASPKSTAEEVEASLKSTAEEVRASSKSTAEEVADSSKSTAKEVETSLKSTAEEVEASPKSTTMIVEASSKSTAEEVEASSKSTTKKVKASSKLTAKKVDASSKSTAKKVEASSKSTAKRVEASPKSTAKKLEASSKSTVMKVETLSKSTAKKVETSSKSTVKRVENSPKSIAKRVETSPNSTVKKVETSSESTAKKGETLSKSIAKVGMSSRSTVKKAESSPKSTVKKVESSSRSNFKAGASSKPTPLKSKQRKSSEMLVTSLKSKSVTEKTVSSIDPSKGSSGQGNSKLKTEKRAASSKVAARKLMTPSRASLPAKPSLSRLASINARKHKSLKIVSHLKNQLKTRGYEHEKPSNDEVEEKTLYVIKMESGNKTLQSDPVAGHDVELSPPQSLSPPKFSSSSQEDKEESEYTNSEGEEDCFSVNHESEHMENGEALEVKEIGKPRKDGTVCSEDKGKKMSKLNFKRGTLVELESVKTSPRRLKFRRATVFGENAKAENQRSPSFKRRYEAGIDRIGTTSGPEKVVLRRRGVLGKKDAHRLFNNVIEETASKLAGTRKSKVKALVGAFETVISLQEKKPPVKTIC